MNRTNATKYVSFVVDDAGAGRELGADIHAIVRNGGGATHKHPDYKYPSVLVGWQCGFEPLFVAVHSYLDVRLDDEEAIEMAQEYLEERGWFGADGPTEPDYVVR